MFARRAGWSLEPNRLSRAIEERRQKGLEILDLTESNPTRCGFDYDARILEALADPRSLTYEPDPRGLLTARHAVAGYYAERGARVEPEQIFLTTSTSEAYSFVFRLLADPGDAVLVPSPSYPLFDFLVRLNDLELTAYPLEYDHGWRMNVAALRGRLETAARARAVLLVHPNNPTGSFVRARELDALAEVCRERSLALVADEVFGDYALAPDAGHPSGPRLRTHAGERRALTFTLSGLSKISALPQMKLAWIVVSGPDNLLSAALARLEVIADTYLSVSAPLAHALPRLLETRRAVQPRLLARLRANLQYLDESLAQKSALSRLKMEGGWYAILKLPATRSDEDWAVEFVRSEGVLVHPGHFYDFQSEGFAVLSLLPRVEAFREGVARILGRVAAAG